MKHYDSKLHVSGSAEFVDDSPAPQGMLHAAVFGSPIAHGTISALNISPALAVTGVKAVFSFDDIPGDGYLGALIQDEPLFAHRQLMYHGQPIALVVAISASVARAAAALIQLETEPLAVVSCPRVAFAQGLMLQASRIYSKGDVEAAWPTCSTVVEGSVELGGQEHLYLETNRARAIPQEDGRLKVYSSTQSPSAEQKSIAQVLGIAMHLVEIDVRRIGGGFGGKESQATPWCCMAALAAYRLQQPVQLVLNRAEDMRMTGKRHPYKQDYKIGLDDHGTILAYQVTHYQNAGAYMDLSAAVLERSILHSTNAYAIANVHIVGTPCRTNLPPSTAFRGFGGPQGMFAMEAAIFKAAQKMGVEPDFIQEQNLISDGYRFHYGQTIKECRMKKVWREAKECFDVRGAKERVASFNAAHNGQKKGLALMPVCFGISFTRTFLNQGSCLVHVYTDGSVALASGGVEMGQGISSNLIAIAARTLGISAKRIRYNSTNTSRIANISPSAASSTTDLNGGATIVACEKILVGLKGVAAKHLASNPESISIVNERVQVNGSDTELGWQELVSMTYCSSVALMAHGFYTSPGIHFDNLAGKGSPFQYYAFGISLIEVTVDCLRGSYVLDSAKVVHDLGRPIIPSVDLGQVEGGLAQGIGWVTLEELSYDNEAKLASNSLSTYKVPDNHFMPNVIDIKFLETDSKQSGPLGSKAVGEPPLMYGIGAYFALRQAISAFKLQQYGDKLTSSDISLSPMTPERVLLSLYPNFLQSGGRDGIKQNQ
ncbi:MAG: molybdopterin-dependent oxidoreductase [Gammaproteobacteria bacterium]|nr:molybdopterin-dependent oxidoreductase [Gammaproteobacteria bacterium]